MNKEWFVKEQCIAGIVIGLFLTIPVWCYLIALLIFNWVIGG